MADFEMSETSGCVPLTINFESSSQGDIKALRWEWDLGQGIQTKTGAQLGVNFTIAGTYNIKLIVTFNDNSVKEITKSVVVHPLPIANFTADNIVGCPGLEVQFTDQSTTATGNITKWNWSFGASASSEQHPKYVFNTTGNYNTSLFVENQWGCKSEPLLMPQYITILNRPVPGFTVTGPTDCQDQFSPVITNITTGAGELSYLWTVSDGRSSEEITPDFELNAAGAYTISLQAANGTNCVMSAASKTIYIGKPATIPTLNAPVSGCINASTSFSLTNLPVSGWVSAIQWDFGNGSMDNSNRTAVTHQFQDPGSKNVTATIRYANGCSEVLSASVTIAPKAAVQLNILPDRGCAVPFTAEFDAVVAPSTGNYSYSWNFGSGNVYNDMPNPSITYTYNEEGTKNIQLIVRDLDNPNPTCNTTVVDRSIQVRIPILQIYRATPTAGCKPVHVVFDSRITNLVTGGNGIIYSWNFGDGSAPVTYTGTGNNVPQAQHLYTTAGNFIVQLTAQTPQGCIIHAEPITIAVAEDCDDGNGGGDGGGSGGGGFGAGIEDCGNPLSRVFSATTIAGMEVICWDFGDATSPSNIGGPFATISHTFTHAATFKVTVTRRVISTGEIVHSSRNIVVNNIPIVSKFSASDAGNCVDVPFLFTPIDIEPDQVTSYIWDFGDGSPKRIINNPLPPELPLTGATSYAYTATGEYTVTLTVIDKNGCEHVSDATTLVKVDGPQADFSADITSFCGENFTVNFTPNATPVVSSIKIKSWQWNFGDGHTATIENDKPFSYTYTHNRTRSTFDVSLRVVDANNCSSTITIKDDYIKAYRPTAAFQVIDPIRCEDYEVQFVNRSTGYGTPTDARIYTWDFGDGSELVTTNNSTISPHTYPGNGDYTVTLTIMDENNCTDVATITNAIRIVEPVPDFTFGSEIEDCAPISLGFTNTSNTHGQPATYTWSFGDNSTGSTDFNPQPITYTRPDDYEVILTVCSMGCKREKKHVVNVKGPRGALHTTAIPGCLPYELNMEVTGSNIGTYAWDLNDGTPVEISRDKAEIKHVYENAGVFRPNVILTSLDGACKFTLRPSDLIIVDDAKAVINDHNLEFCETAHVQLSESSTVPVFSSFVDRHWKLHDGSIVDASTGNLEQFFNAPGSYPVSLHVTSQYGCESNAEVTVTVHAPPSISIEGATEQCLNINTPTLFKSHFTSEDQIVGFQWLVNGIAINATQDALQHSFLQDGNYDVGFRLETAHGCDVTEVHAITVHPLPIPQLQPETITICEGSTTELVARDGVTYIWTPAGSILSGMGTNAIVVSPDETTTYEVKVTNAFHCSQTATAVVAIDRKVNLTHTGNKIICIGESVQLSAAGNTSRFIWTPVEGLNNPRIPNPVAKPAFTTTYIVTGESENVCPDETAAILVAVGNYPTLDLGTELTLQAGAKQVLKPITSPDVISYAWRNTPGLSCYDCAEPYFYADKNTMYTLTVANEYGCKTSASIPVKVTCGESAVHIPNAFTPNSDGNNDVFYIQGYGISNIRSLRIYDRWGKMVFEAVNIPANNSSVGWNGVIKGQDTPTSATFVYVAEMECETGGKIFKKGSVSLIK